MAKVLSGSDMYPNFFKPKSVGNFTAPNSVRYAACSVSNFNDLYTVGDAVLPRDICDAIHEGHEVAVRV